jgi:hypothetical protein
MKLILIVTLVGLLAGCFVFLAISEPGPTCSKTNDCVVKP